MHWALYDAVNICKQPTLTVFHAGARQKSRQHVRMLRIIKVYMSINLALEVVYSMCVCTRGSNQSATMLDCQHCWSPRNHHHVLCAEHQNTAQVVRLPCDILLESIS